MRFSRGLFLDILVHSYQSTFLRLLLPESSMELITQLVLDKGTMASIMLRPDL
jgi:hypothetical protein